MAEKLSVVMARKHLEAADIALLVIDATEGVSQLDATIAGYAHDAAPGLFRMSHSRWQRGADR